LVREWEGKEILFPESMVFTRYGVDTLDCRLPDPDYTIVSNDVVSSCGCISVVFPKAPVCPGNDLVITATYMVEKPEYFSKVLTVYANTKTPLRLTIRGSAH
jgi:hypothetical protein